MADEEISEEIQPDEEPDTEETEEPEQEEVTEEKAKSEKPEKEEKPKSSDNIKPQAFKRFLKHLIVITKKQKIKVKAQQALTKHIKELKETPASKLDPKKLRKKLERLNTKLYDVLDAEKNLAAVGREDPEVVKMLKDEIIELKKRLVDLESEKNKHAGQNKRNVDDLTYQLSKAQEKVARFVDKKVEREQRISELMTKIKSTPTRKHDIIAAKQKIEELERRYNLLVSKKSFRKEQLEALKQRIDELKQKLPAQI